jgi:hypothetical protein
MRGRSEHEPGALAKVRFRRKPGSWVGVVITTGNRGRSRATARVVVKALAQRKPTAGLSVVIKARIRERPRRHDEGGLFAVGDARGLRRRCVRVTPPGVRRRMRGIQN